VIEKVRCGSIEYDELVTPQEIMVFLLGHEFFHYLVDTEQQASFPTLKQEERAAEKYGRDWLRRWRCGASNRRV
jgi:hypothetical protein